MIAAYSGSILKDTDGPKHVHSSPFVQHSSAAVSCEVMDKCLYIPCVIQSHQDVVRWCCSVFSHWNCNHLGEILCFFGYKSIVLIFASRCKHHSTQPWKIPNSLGSRSPHDSGFRHSLWQMHRREDPFVAFHGCCQGRCTRCVIFIHRGARTPQNDGRNVELNVIFDIQS